MVSECKRTYWKAIVFYNEDKWTLEADPIVHTKQLSPIEGATAQAVVDKIDESMRGNTSFVWPAEHPYEVYYSDRRGKSRLKTRQCSRLKSFDRGFNAVYTWHANLVYSSMLLLR